MPLLSEKVAAETRDILAAMREPVLMTCFTGPDCRGCGNVVDLAREVTSLAPALRLEVRDFAGEAAAAAALGVDRLPALVLRRAGEGRAPVRYFGLPAGHEFGAFLRTLVLLSTGRGYPGVDAAAVAPIARPAHLAVFVLAA